VLVIQNRQARCAAVPFVTPELLPNAALESSDQPSMPTGWSAAAPGVELQGSAGKGFDYNNDGRALQLIGIGNFVQTPPIAVQPGARYCFTGRALTDSAKHSATRLRLVFDWRDAQNRPLGKHMTNWQQVVLWQPEAPPGDDEVACSATPVPNSMISRSPSAAAIWCGCGCATTADAPMPGDTVRWAGNQRPRGAPGLPK